MRRMFADVLDPVSPDGLLDGLADEGDIVDGLPWTNNQVDMFGHEHVRPKSEVQLGASAVDCFLQPLAHPLGLEKRVAVVTAESEFVSIAGVVEVLAMPALGATHPDHAL